MRTDEASQPGGELLQEDLPRLIFNESQNNPACGPRLFLLAE